MQNVKQFVDFIWKIYKMKFNGDMIVNFNNGVPVLVKELNRSIKIADLKDY